MEASIFSYSVILLLQTNDESQRSSGILDFSKISTAIDILMETINKQLRKNIAVEKRPTLMSYARIKNKNSVFYYE